MFLTPEGQGIFAAHIRMDKAQGLASYLGYLIQVRIERPLDQSVVVLDLGDRAEFDENQKWIAWQAVWRTPNFVGIDDLWMMDLEDHFVMDEQGREAKINEVELPGGNFVSTYLGSTSCRVLLTPESVLPAK